MISKTAISHLMYCLKYKSLFTFFHELVKVGRHKGCLIDKKEQSTCQHKMLIRVIDDETLAAHGVTRAKGLHHRLLVAVSEGGRRSEVELV